MRKVQTLSTTIAVATVVSGTISMGFLGFNAQLTGELINKEMGSWDASEPMHQAKDWREWIPEDKMNSFMDEDHMMDMKMTKPPMMKKPMMKLHKKPAGAEEIKMKLKMLEESGLMTDEAIVLKAKLHQMWDDLEEKRNEEIKLTEDDHEQIRSLLEEAHKVLSSAKKNNDDVRAMRMVFKEKLQAARESGDEAAVQEVLDMFAQWRQDNKKDMHQEQMWHEEDMPMHEDMWHEDTWEMDIEEVGYMLQDTLDLMDAIDEADLNLHNLTMDAAELAVETAENIDKYCDDNAEEVSAECDLALRAVNGHMMTMQDLIDAEMYENEELAEVIDAFYSEDEWSDEEEEIDGKDL